ncbi:MAG: hypothetical protein IPO05_13310 [Flavobacteriales bacterium]|jgi:ABC-type transporter Mla subunit MlaD|nr:hypothetical protein [Flavobacteriales bacterium]MBK9514566.1 hypothetical protein [Flavobacteriales bacterium]HOZ40049.1 hypothetical protein [Flavobacteriales bacterium]
MRTFALIATALFLSFTSAQAQSGTAATATVQTPQQQEVRALSGQLKETLGTVQQLSISNNKQLKTATGAELDRLGQLRTEIAGMMTRLEKNLTAVNTASPDGLAAARTDAQASIELANALVAKVKGVAPAGK